MLFMCGAVHAGRGCKSFGLKIGWFKAGELTHGKDLAARLVVSNPWNDTCN